MIVDIEKILLTRKEKRLLKYIGKHGLWEKDKRIYTQEFQSLNSYGLITDYADERFPIEYKVTDTIPEPNAYKASQRAFEYLRYVKMQKQNKRLGLGRDMLLLIAGGIITFVAEHIGEIFRALCGIFQ